MAEIQFVDKIEALVLNLSKVKLRETEDIVAVVYTAMQFMKLYKDLHGLSKRKIVVTALKEIVKDYSGLSQAPKALLLIAIDAVAPQAIDMIYRASIEGIKFNLKNSTCCVPQPREK